MNQPKRPLRIFPAGVILLCILLALSSSCSRRYWFRKKVKSTVPDSTEMDKEYRIVW